MFRSLYLLAVFILSLATAASAETSVTSVNVDVTVACATLRHGCNPQTMTGTDWLQLQENFAQQVPSKLQRGFAGAFAKAVDAGNIIFPAANGVNIIGHFTISFMGDNDDDGVLPLTSGGNNDNGGDLPYSIGNTDNAGDLPLTSGDNNSGGGELPLIDNNDNAGILPFTAIHPGNGGADEGVGSLPKHQN